jgi:hypothetical protein
VEISRRTEEFGHIAQVFSTFEDRVSIDDEEPVARGINSFQLVFHDNTWSIVSMSWDHESGTRVIPSRYLTKDSVL